LLRALSKVRKNHVSIVDHALEMKELRHAIISGTISKALYLGRTYRITKEEDKDFAQEVAKAGDDIVVFKGTIRSFDWKTFEGFTVGQFISEGNAGNENDELKMWFKNENLISCLNDELFVTLPDLIYVIDIDSNEPVTNPNYRNGMNIIVVVYPAPVD